MLYSAITLDTAGYNRYKTLRSEVEEGKETYETASKKGKSYLNGTRGIEQNTSQLWSTSRVGADVSFSRDTSSVVTRCDTEVVHRHAVKGVDNAIPCHCAGYGRLRQAQHSEVGRGSSEGYNIKKNVYKRHWWLSKQKYTEEKSITVFLSTYPVQLYLSEAHGIAETCQSLISRKVPKSQRDTTSLCGYKVRYGDITSSCSKGSGQRNIVSSQWIQQPATGASKGRKYEVIRRR